MSLMSMIIIFVRREGKLCTALARVTTFHNFTRPKCGWSPWTWGQEGSWCWESARGPLKSGR